MRRSDLILLFRGATKPVTYVIATDERDRWIDGHQPDHLSDFFGEYRTIDHLHLFINSNHLVVAQLLNDQILEVADNYDAAWKQREQPNATTGEYSSELWRFRFWMHGCKEVFVVDDLDEHDFVTISCGLLNNEHEGRSFITVVDEDNEPISLRIGDIMLAEGFMKEPVTKSIIDGTISQKRSRASSN